MFCANVAKRFFVVASLILIAPALQASSAEDQALFRATNRIRVTDSNVSLRHPLYDVIWTPERVHFAPRRGPSWSWSLERVNLGASRLEVAKGVVPVVDRDRAQIDYHRGALTERYLYRKNTVEQQFVIPQRLSGAAHDLVIEGAVRSNGSFAATNRGWVWSDRNGVVSLGKLTVYDRRGERLPSHMDVRQDQVRLMVDGVALARAAYPVTIDPEIGTNDFRISNAGTDGTTTVNAYAPAAAYDPANNQFLVVWQQYSGVESEIFGQYIDGSTGTEAGSDFQISFMGPNGAPSALYNADTPAVAFNTTNNEYLVVWRADDNNAPLIDEEYEIFGRRITAGGSPIGTDGFRISNMGADSNASSGSVSYGKVAYNSVNNEYLVVWDGQDGNGEREIRGQRLLGATGAETGSQMTYSTIGPSFPNAGYANRMPTNAPDVAYNSFNAEYLVVWAADALATDNENEVYGQRVAAITGAEMGSDFQISDMGPPGNQNYVAYNVGVAANTTNGQYLVVWNGTDNVPPLVQFENEIFGQLLGPTGLAVGADDFRISNCWIDGDTTREALDPDVAYSATVNQYLVAWRGEGGPTNDELEIWAQRLDDDGTAIGGDVKISDMGPDDNTAYRPFSQQIATAGATFLIVWFSDDDSGLLVDDENEIWGQFFAASADLPSPLIDDFSVNQSLTLGAINGTVFDHSADNAAIHGGERNLRIGGLNATGQPVTINVTGGALTFNRQSSPSAGQIDLWWDGLNNSNNFDPNTSVPYDFTANGTLDSFRIAVNSSTSASLRMRLSVWTTGASLSQILFTLPTGGGDVDLLFSNFSAGANFGAVRAIFFGTETNSGAWNVSIDSIRLRSSTFGAPASLTATATSTSAVALSWPAVGGATSYEIWRSTLGSAFSLLTTTGGVSYDNTLLSANQTYLYKMKAVAPGETSGYGPVDAATTVIFTDPALNNTIMVKAVHITQLRTAVNAMQLAAGQLATSFTDAIAAGVVIRNYHITQMRTALDAARSTIGLSVSGYTDPTLTATVTPVKAIHITQLRAGTQ